MSHGYHGRQRYVFAKHGWPDVLRRRRRRRAQRRQPQCGTSIPTLQTISLCDATHHERLLEAYDDLRREGGPAPGIDGLTFADYGTSEIAGVLRATWRSIQEGTYRPAPPRIVRKRKRGGGHRTLRLRTIVDRTVGKALARALTPLIDPLFLETSFGFRPGRSHLQLLAALEARMIETDAWVLFIDDIRQAFDNVPIAISVSNYRILLADSALVNLIEVVLRGDDGPLRERGIDQGCPFSPLTLNVFLNETLDRPILTDRDSPSHYRYADNVVCACGGVPEGERALQNVREALQTHGLELKGQDGPPVDLTRNEARASLLGFQISKQDGRIRYELEDHAWQDLKDGLEEAHLSDRPGLTAQAVARGWTAGHAPALATDAETVLRRIKRVLREAGLRYEVPEHLLRDCIRRTAEQWERIRSQALRSLVEPQWNSSQRSAPRAVYQTVSSQEVTDADDSVTPSDTVDAESSAPF
jgi:RNA-directed DNA polymerase